MTNQRRRRWTVAGACLVVALIGVFGASVRAKTGVVTTKDGQRFEGDVSETDRDIVVDIHGVKTVIPRENLASLNYPASPEQQFQDRLNALDPKDVRGRIDLAKWAIDQRQYDQARTALDQAQALDPNNREVFDLQNLVRQQMRLDRVSRSPSTQSTPSAPPVPPGQTPKDERKLVSAADINAIRQRELKAGDGVNVRFLNQVEQRFARFRNIQQTEFMTLKPVDRALRIINEGDPSFRDDVKIMTDPPSIAEYRRTIQPIVLNGCATANCHGGNKGGTFMLYAPAENDQITYTNFYILSKYAKKLGEANTGGMFGGAAERRMIDRSKPASSLLLQYSLPVQVSEYDHPSVPNYDGLFRTRDDARYRAMSQWIEHSLTPVQPDYGIRYDFPGASPSTTQPNATTPTTTPAR
jgi:hypothetical protein